MISQQLDMLKLKYRIQDEINISIAEIFAYKELRSLSVIAVCDNIEDETQNKQYEKEVKKIIKRFIPETHNIGLNLFWNISLHFISRQDQEKSKALYAVLDTTVKKIMAKHPELFSLNRCNEDEIYVFFYTDNELMDALENGKAQVLENELQQAFEQAKSELYGNSYFEEDNLFVCFDSKQNLDTNYSGSFEVRFS